MPNASAADRLTKSLTCLTAPVRGETPYVTVAALCRSANISRNSLYRYHPQILLALREHQERHAVKTQPLHDASEDIRAEISLLRSQVPKLVALVDHYQAAYCEAHALLNRRNQELADLRRRLDLKPIKLTRGRNTAHVAR